jgi:hypothetical protein
MERYATPCAVSLQNQSSNRETVQVALSVAIALTGCADVIDGNPLRPPREVAAGPDPDPRPLRAMMSAELGVLRSLAGRPRGRVFRRRCRTESGGRVVSARHGGGTRPSVLRGRACARRPPRSGRVKDGDVNLQPAAELQELVIGER